LLEVRVRVRVLINNSDTRYSDNGVMNKIPTLRRSVGRGVRRFVGPRVRVRVGVKVWVGVNRVRVRVRVGVEV